MRIHAESRVEKKKTKNTHTHTSESAAESLIPHSLPLHFFPSLCGRVVPLVFLLEQNKRKRPLGRPAAPRACISGAPPQNPTRNKLHHHACARALESLVPPPPAPEEKMGRQKSVPNCTGSSQGQFQPAHTAPDEVISARTAPGRLLAVFSKQQKIK